MAARLKTMRGELERSLAQTYIRLTYASAILMASGWLWHLIRGDPSNWLIHTGIGLLLVTPIIALVHLAWLAREWERTTARYCGIALALVVAAVLIGLFLHSGR